MSPNLEAEMARNKVTQVKLAEILGITPTTLSFKMNGKSTLSLKECVEIKRKLAEFIGGMLKMELSEEKTLITHSS